MKTIRRALSLLLALCLILSLTGPLSNAARTETYTAYIYRDASLIFDTEISLKGYAKSEEEFARVAQETMALLREYDHIFDGYNAYDDLHNLYYLNLHAAEGPVEVPKPLFDLLSWCQDQWNAGYHTVNVAMGAVLSIWHEYREAGNADPENAKLPPMEDLVTAAEHIDFTDLVLDPEKQTVFYADPLLRLDIGAVGKGWAADAVLPYLYENMPSFILNLGGNVYAGDPPLDGRAAWAVGVQDPTADEMTLLLGGSQYLDILDVNGVSVVTSGDYWRYYTVDGVRYHHIIDPDTLMPSRQMLSVTVVCESSALADFLSTTLFILPYEEGLALVSGLEGVEVMWMLADETVYLTPGMADYARIH